MRHNSNHYCLNLDLGFVVDFNIVNVLTVDPSRVNHFVVKTIDSKLTEFLKTCNIAIPHAEVFYTPPMSSLPAHVDDDVLNHHCKLNFVFGANGSRMQWWQYKDLDQPLTYHMSAIGTRYIRVDTADCDLVWEAEVGRPGLVNAGQPHSVSNMTNEPRWCLSYVLYDLKNRSLLDWHDAESIFSEYVSGQ
jgi:hypothetical protein